jgi:chemosensory pili system protein ChpA (sensor histidine kinase/response regulator)
MTFDSLPEHTPSADDLSALSWVHEELRRTLEAAHKSLRRHLRESDSIHGSDLGAVDPAVLRQARNQLHQAAGALELIGLRAGASLLQASEAAVQRGIAKPSLLDLPAVETIERASFALLDFVARRLAGKPVSALGLFPQYRAVQQLAGTDRVHPADLWTETVPAAVLPPDAGAAPRAADDELRGEVEAQMLALLRQPRGPAAARMSELFAGLGNGSGDAEQATLWHLAAAAFEGLAKGLLPVDVYGKRLAPRLLAQLRLAQRAAATGEPAAVSERLRRDLLFFCAQAGAAADAASSPRLAAARRAFGFAGRRAVDYEAPTLGRFDPTWIAQARKRVEAAKDSWSAVAGGERMRFGALNEQVALVGDSLRRLYKDGEALATALQSAVAATVERGEPPPPELAMEVASALLYLDASLEDADFDDPSQAARVQRLAQRIGMVRTEGRAPPLEGWMEDLYRRVSDRQTMGSVVHELRVALGEVEKAIDQHFRDPSNRDVMIPVGGQLQTMRGVLSVLGLDDGALAAVRMRSDVEALIGGGALADDVVDRLTANLGSLGFMVDMLGVQPVLAKALFVFDATAGRLRSRVDSEAQHGAAPAGALPPALVEQAQALALAAAHPEVDDAEVLRALERLLHEATVADQSALAQLASRARAALERAGDAAARQAARENLAQAMAEAVAGTVPAVAEPAAAAPAPAAVADDEMREIFIEEAREVVAAAREAVDVLEGTPDDLASLTAVRRAFHTLKGSSRMVGLADFGDAAWACEQLYNARLADTPRADADLLGFTRDALDHLEAWADAAAAGRDDHHRAQPLREAADALRLRGRREQVQAPAATAPSLAEAVPGLPLASELAFDAAAFELPAGAIEAVEPAPALPDLDDVVGAAPIDAAALDAALAEPPPPEPTGEPVAEPIDESFVLELPTLAGEPAGVAAEPPTEVAFELDLSALEPAPSLEAGPDAQAACEAGDAIPADLMPMPAEPLADFALELGEPVAADTPAAQPDVAAEAEQYKTIGPLRIGIALFNVYLNEADELSRRLCTELAEWAHELHRPVGDSTIALAHSLAGSSATVGYEDLSGLARSLEHALARSHALGAGTPDEAELFEQTADTIRRLLHQFAAGFLHPAPELLLDRLAAHERECAERAQAAPVAVAEPSGWDTPSLAGSVEAFAVDVVEPVPVDTAVTSPPDAVDGPAAGPAAVSSAAAADAEATMQAFAIDVAEPGRAQIGVATPPHLEAFALDVVAPAAPAAPAVEAFALDDDDDLDVEDAVDADLLPVFEEEAHDLLPQLAAQMREWAHRPDDAGGASACMRTLHTLKGGARLAGAMRLGELAHRLETAIEQLLARGDVHGVDVERLQARVDHLGAVFDALRGTPLATPGASAPAPAPTLPPVVAPTAPAAEPAPAVAAAGQPPARFAPATAGAIDWSRFATPAAPAAARAQPVAAAASSVRVRVPLLDRLVNHAGEVSITRSRIEADVGQLKDSLADLSDNLERLRRQLRDLELQAETQIASRMEQAKAAAQEFDPLELDRFTRFQELTRMMAESVNDVATVQRSLQRALQSAEDQLAAQARLTRDLQDDLLRTRMVEFEGLSERLYRVVRQAAKETGKQVRLDIVGGSIEVDRGVLDRMTPAFEHVLRNCVTHGIERPEARAAAGKDAAGQITVTLTHEGNEVGIEFGDDGAGLDLARIRARGVALGLIAPDAPVADAELAQLIFAPGFSTAEKVTELAGRGIGMDVVRSDVLALGGRIETTSVAGRGTRFKLLLPLTTAVTQVLMLRCGEVTLAVPSTLVEAVRRVGADDVERALAGGTFAVGDEVAPFFWLGALLDTSARSAEAARSVPVVAVRSAQQRVVLQVDEVLGNQEVVVKNLGPQLSRLPGLAGMTLLPSGQPTLIYNPVALAALYGEQARAATASAPATRGAESHAEADLRPLVLVVDDSLTVRRVTQRLLEREGYRVALAKDGLDAIERLAAEKPALVLSDIEMPRMDGFDLVRNLRSDARWRDLPVIMITSRIAQKHRDVAAQLGVNHYLGKPYAEEELLALVARYATAALPA